MVVLDGKIAKRTHRARPVPLLCLLLPVFLLAADTLGSRSVSEQEVKAAMLYNFTKFVEWPAGSLGGPLSPFCVCVLGQDPFGEALDRVMAGRSVTGRPLRVIRARQTAGIKGCHVLFVSASERKRVSEILQAVPQPGSLTVGDVDQFTGSGGMLGFVLKDSNVRFEVDLGAAERARLKISARLIRLARNVRQGAAGGRKSR